MLISNKKNKKGSFPIVLLVFLVLLVSSVSLFVFITRSSETISQVSSIGIINNLRIEKNTMNFYISEITKNSIIFSYHEMTKHGNYVQNPEFYGVGQIVIFQTLKINLEKDFENLFIDNFKDGFRNHDFSGKHHLEKLKNASIRGDFETSFNGKEIEVNFPNSKNFEIKIVSSEIGILHKPTLSFITILSELGLDSFEDIYFAKESCKSEENYLEIEPCFNNLLKGFLVEVIQRTNTEDEEYLVINFKSKNLYWIEGELKNIEFSFIPI